GGVPDPAAAAGGGDARPAGPRRSHRSRRRTRPVRPRAAGPGGADGLRAARRARREVGGVSAVAEVPEEVLRGVRERLARESAPLTPHLVAEALRAQGRPVGDAVVLAVHDALRRDVAGAGPLEGLLRTPGVTDVLVNGPDSVWI